MKLPLLSVVDTPDASAASVTATTTTMFLSHRLTFEDKLLIIAAAASLVCFTIIFMACKLMPCCLLHKYCPFRQKYIDDEKEKRRRLSTRSQMLYYNGPHPPMTKTQLLQNGKAKDLKQQQLVDSSSLLLSGDELKQNFTTKRESTPHRLSVSSTSASSGPSATEGSPPSLRKQLLQRTMVDACGELLSVVEKPEPQLDFGVSFDKDRAKLMVFVKSARNIPLSLYGTANDCCTRVYIIKDTKRRWRRRSQISLDELRADNNGYVVTEFKTQLARRTTTPVFSEQFIADLQEKEQKFTMVKLVLSSFDRFSHETIVGEAQVALARLTPSEMHSYSVMLKELAKDMGQIMISLTYLPTAERLCVMVLKATNLQAPYGQKTANPYVRVSLVQRAKILEKQKTPTRSNTLNPVYNETLTLDLPKEEVEKVSLIVTVLHDMQTGPLSEPLLSPDELPINKGSSFKSPRRKSVSNLLELAATASFNPDSSPIFKSRSVSSVRAKPVILGQLSLGPGAQDMERSHWMEVIRNPRKQFAQWHKLVQ